MRPPTRGAYQLCVAFTLLLSLLAASATCDSFSNVDVSVGAGAYSDIVIENAPSSVVITGATVAGEISIGVNPAATVTLRDVNGTGVVVVGGFSRLVLERVSLAGRLMLQGGTLPGASVTMTELAAEGVHIGGSVNRSTVIFTRSTLTGVEKHAVYISGSVLHSRIVFDRTRLTATSTKSCGVTLDAVSVAGGVVTWPLSSESISADGAQSSALPGLHFNDCDVSLVHTKVCGYGAAKGVHHYFVRVLEAGSMHGSHLSLQRTNATARTVGYSGLFHMPATALVGDISSTTMSTSNRVVVVGRATSIYLYVDSLTDGGLHLDYPLPWRPRGTAVPGILLVLTGSLTRSTVALTKGAQLDTTLLAVEFMAHSTVRVEDAAVDVLDASSQFFIRTRGGVSTNSSIAISRSSIRLETTTTCGAHVRVLSLLSTAWDPTFTSSVTDSALVGRSPGACGYGSAKASFVEIVRFDVPGAVVEAHDVLRIHRNNITVTAAGYAAVLNVQSVVSGPLHQPTVDSNNIRIWSGYWTAVFRVQALANATFRPSPGPIAAPNAISASVSQTFLRVDTDATNVRFVFDRVTAPLTVLTVGLSLTNATLLIEHCDISAASASSTRPFIFGSPQSTHRSVSVVVRYSNITSYSSATCSRHVVGAVLPFSGKSLDQHIELVGNTIKAHTTMSSCGYGAAKASTATGIEMSVQQLQSVTIRNNRFISRAIGTSSAATIVEAVDGADTTPLTHQGNTYSSYSASYSCRIFTVDGGIANASFTIDGHAQPGIIEPVSRCGRQPHTLLVFGSVVNAHLRLTNLAINHSTVNLQADVRQGSTVTIADTTVLSYTPSSAYGLHVSGVVRDTSAVVVRNTTISVTSGTTCSGYARAISLGGVAKTARLQVVDSHLHSETSQVSCGYGAAKASVSQTVQVGGAIDGSSFAMSGSSLHSVGTLEAIGVQLGTLTGELPHPASILLRALYERCTMYHVDAVVNATIVVDSSVLAPKSRAALALHAVNMFGSRVAVGPFDAIQGVRPFRADVVGGDSDVQVTSADSTSIFGSMMWPGYIRVAALNGGSRIRVRSSNVRFTSRQSVSGCSTVAALIAMGPLSGNATLEVLDSTMLYDTRPLTCNYGTSRPWSDPTFISATSVADATLRVRRVTGVAVSNTKKELSRVANINSVGAGGVVEFVDVTANATIGVDIAATTYDANRINLRRIRIGPANTNIKTLFVIRNLLMTDLTIADCHVITNWNPEARRSAASPAHVMQLDAGTNMRKWVRTRCNDVDGHQTDDLSSIARGAAVVHDVKACGECTVTIDCNPANTLSVSGEAPDSCGCLCPAVPVAKQDVIFYDAECNRRERFVTPTAELTLSRTPVSVSATPMLAVLGSSTRTLELAPVTAAPTQSSAPNTSAAATTTAAATVPATARPTTAAAAPVETTAAPIVTTTAVPVRGVTRTVTILPTEAPPPKKPAPKLARALGDVVDASTAEAVTSGANSAAAVGGAASATSATKASNMANIIGVAQCQFDPEEDLQVSALEVIVPWSVGDTRFAPLLGPIVSTNVFAVLPHVFSLVLHLVATEWKKTRLFVGMLAPIMAGYLLPTAIGFAVLVLGHAESYFDRIVFGAGGIALTVAVGFGPALPIRRRLGNGVPTDEDGKFIWPGTDSLLLGLRYYFDVVRDVRDPLVLLAYFEDLGIAMAMSVAASLKIPGVDCRIVATLLSLLAVLHLVYLGRKKPFRPRIDSAFAYAVSFLQAVVALAVVGSLFRPSSSQIVGYLALTLGLSFMAQTVVMLGWTFVQLRRRKQSARRRARKREAKSLEQALLVPTTAEGAHGDDSGAGVDRKAARISERTSAPSDSGGSFSGRLASSSTDAPPSSPPGPPSDGDDADEEAPRPANPLLPGGHPPPLLHKAQSGKKKPQPPPSPPPPEPPAPGTLSSRIAGWQMDSDDGSDDSDDNLRGRPPRYDPDL